jgi:hypothetical protein
MITVRVRRPESFATLAFWHGIQLASAYFAKVFVVAFPGVAACANFRHGILLESLFVVMLRCFNKKVKCWIIDFQIKPDIRIYRFLPAFAKQISLFFARFGRIKVDCNGSESILDAEPSSA